MSLMKNIVRREDQFLIYQSTARTEILKYKKCYYTIITHIIIVNVK
jgi:hypothetical protein